jgi:hypothetical protein
MFKLASSNTVTFFVILVLVLFVLYFLLNKSHEKFVEFFEDTNYPNEVKQKTRSCSQNSINNALKGYVFNDYRSLSKE